jgi:hypothetical protein
MATELIEYNREEEVVEIRSATGRGLVAYIL